MSPRTPMYIYLAGFVCGIGTALIVVTLFPFFGTSAGMATMILFIVFSLPYTMLFSGMRRKFLNRRAASKAQSE